MGRIVGWRALFLCSVASVFMVFGVPSALADDFHGIAIAKQCTSPVKIGDPYTCAVQILNVVDIPANDTLRVTGISDVVHSAGGDVATGNIMPTTGLVFSGAVTCTGGTGTGTSGIRISARLRVCCRSTRRSRRSRSRITRCRRTTSICPIIS